MSLPKPDPCRGCPLDTLGHGFAPPEGPTTAPLLWMGEALGGTEAALGRPFVGDAGGMLQRLLKLLGLRREDQRIGNVISCRPPGDWMDGTPQAPWFHGSIAHCNVYRQRLLAEPHQVVIALGSTALKTLMELHGHKKIRVNDFHGAILRDPSDRFWVVPTFHPSFLQRGAHNLIGAVLWDLQQAQHAAQHGKPQDDHSLIIDPPIEWFRAWVDSAVAARQQDPWAYPISSDIETPDKAGGRDEGELGNEDVSFQILRWNVSINPDEGMTVPYAEPYISELRRLHRSPGPIWGWNFIGYDFARVVKADIMQESAFPQVIDLMWCLSGKTQVMLWGGGVRRIRDVVVRRESVTLVGMDDAGVRVPVRVVGWHRHRVPKQSWLRVSTWGSRYSFVCTPDHKVWTRVGWKRADALTATDEIPTHKLGSDDLIHGTLLGDGYIDDQGTLQLCHGAPQREWISLKAAHLGVRPFDRSHGWVGCATPLGKDWRDRFYRSDRSKRLILPSSPAALAVWYCDDGNVHNIGKERTGRARIALDAFTQKEREATVVHFTTLFGDGATLHKNRGAHSTLVLRRTAVERFFGAIAPFVPPCMEYKLPPRYRGRYAGWLETAVPRWAKIRSVTTTKHKGDRYCVTVDHPTHRFFVRGGLVSNCWHRLQSDLPRGLGFAAPFYSSYGPWKHISEKEPGRYGAVDGLQNHRVGFGVMRDLESTGLLRSALRYVHQLMYQALRPAQIIGVQADRVALAQFKQELGVKATALLDQIQERIPDALKPLTPKQGLTKKPAADLLHVKASAFTRKGEKRAGKEQSEIKLDLYKRAVVIERVVEKDILVCSTCGAVDVQRRHRCADKSLTPAVGLETRPVRRWFWQEPFNPDSPDQVLAYIKYKKHPVGRAKKTQKESTNKETLKKLTRTGDPFYARLLDYRAVMKAKGTYADGTERRMDAMGRVHPEPTFAPSTARLSYVNPNITNVIADKSGKDNIAAGFRKCIVATSTNRLLEVDFGGSEAVDFGWLIKDPQHIRLAGLGLHSGLASYILAEQDPKGWRPFDAAWSDKDLGAFFKTIKESDDQVVKETYDRSKRFVHGFSYGLSLQGMVLQFPEIFPTLKVAEKYADLFMQLSPNAVPWHRLVREQAHVHHFLGGPGDVRTNRWAHPFGFKHWFWSVYTHKKITAGQYWKAIGIARRKGWSDDQAPVMQIEGQYFKVSLGEDGKRCVAFLPQSITAGKLQEVMLRLFDPALPSYIGDHGEILGMRQTETGVWEYHKDALAAPAACTPLRAPIHDSLLLEIPARKFELVAETVFREMQRPFQEMPVPLEWGFGPYLATPVSAKTGKPGGSWAAMEKLSVPGFAELGVGSDRIVSAPTEDLEEDLDDFAREIA